MYSNPVKFRLGSISKDDTKKSLPTHSLNAPLCSEHGDQLSSYCEEDETLVCSSCLLYGSHKHHQSKLVNEAAVECRHTLVKLTPDIREMTDLAENSLTEIDTVIKSVNDSSHRLSDEIDSHFNELVKVLEKRRKEMKVDILHRSQNRVEALLEQKE